MISSSAVGGSSGTSSTPTWISTGVAVGQELLQTTNAKDPERFAKAQAWYAAAIQNDTLALCMLKYMGGMRGCAPGGCGGAQTCGFATAVAKQYTEYLYQKALGVLSGATSPADPILPPPSPSPSLPPFITKPIIAGAGPVKEGIVQQRVTDWFKVALPWIVVIVGGVTVVFLVRRARGG